MNNVIDRLRIRSLSNRASLPFTARCQWLARAAPVMGLLIATALCTQGQQTGYFYDSSGNLIIQAADAVIPPQITGQPVAQIADPGDLVSYSVVVADASGATFQWMF